MLGWTLAWAHFRNTRGELEHCVMQRNELHAQESIPCIRCVRSLGDKYGATPFEDTCAALLERSVREHRFVSRNPVCPS